MSFTFSALADLLSNSFGMYKDEKFPAPGNYYYNEIKSAKFFDRCVIVKESSLDIISDKIEGFSTLQKKKLIVRGLSDFAHRNIPTCDAEMLCCNMRWKIE